MSGDVNPNGTGQPAPGPSSDGRGGRHLPPPAFPPGARQVTVQQAAGTSDDFSAALIQPDDPIPDRMGSGPDNAFSHGAFISPDEPIRRRAPHTSAVAEALDADEAVVTGIGDDAHMGAEEIALGFDPHVLEVVDKVGKLAEALKRRGEAGLRATPEMSRFEATIRSYCVGYIAGRRASEEES